VQRLKLITYDNLSAGGDLASPPEPDEIEVSVFGPIYGESVVLHLGGRNWFIVDSCLDVDKQPAPLSYLKTLKIDIARDVKQIIVSHWHDDHIRGISNVVEQCENAEVVCTEAFGSREFLQLLQAFDIELFSETTGIFEFRSLLNILKERAGRNREDTISLRRAMSDRVLWKNEASGDSYIYSLSPSDAAVLAANLDFKTLLPTGEERGSFRIMPHKPNFGAIVLMAVSGDLAVLLGSDLEETSHRGVGWATIASSTLRPQLKSFLYKVPHHGSSTGHNDDVWKRMLHEDPIAVVTPFGRGKSPLPTPDDVRRISSLTPNAFSTAPAVLTTKAKREWTVEKTIRESGIAIRRINVVSGQIRVRVKPGQEPRTELFGQALRLVDLYPVKRP
jgi:hypothetical protein